MFTKISRPLGAGHRGQPRIRRALHRRRAVLVVALAVGAGLVGVQGQASAAVPGLVRVSATSPSSSDEFKGVTVTCPAGTKVVGVGGEIVGGRGEVVLSAVRPAMVLGETAWAWGIEDRDGFAGTWSVRAHAVCADPLPGLQLISASTGPASSLNPQTVTAACPAGKRLLGTGFDMWGFDATRAVAVRSVTPNAALTAFSVGAAELGAAGTSGTWGISAYGLCADPVPGLERISVKSPSTSIDKSATAPCPAGKQATGAGAAVGAPVSADVAVTRLKPNGSPPTSASVTGHEYGSYPGNWTITAHTICATA